jgi:hypothetical protein
VLHQKLQHDLDLFVFQAPRQIHHECDVVAFVLVVRVVVVVLVVVVVVESLSALFDQLQCFDRLV